MGKNRITSLGCRRNNFKDISKKQYDTQHFNNLNKIQANPLQIQLAKEAASPL